MKSKRLLLAALLALTATGAYAKSTTAVAISTDSTAAPGRTITIHVVLTGKHYVYGGGCTFHSGQVNLSQGSTIINGTSPTTLNSNVIDSQAVPALSGTGCYDQGTGTWYAVKVFGDRTEYDVPYTLPSTIGSYQFSATFVGDGEANGSTSPTVTVAASYPNSAAILDYLLSD